jgi:hypothetical protein
VLTIAGNRCGAIAEIAGEHWLRLARTAAVSARFERGGPPASVPLKPIQEAFDEKTPCAYRRRPTGRAGLKTRRHRGQHGTGGKPITPHQLSKRLAEFYFTGTVRTGITAQAELKQFVSSTRLLIPLTPPRET